MLFRREEKRQNTFSTADENIAKFLGISLDGISADKAKEAAFYTCLRVLSDTLSKLPLKLLHDTNNGTYKATDHYLYSLLKLRPNQFMSASSFWKAIEWNRLYYGHALAYIDTDKLGRIVGLYPLDMSKMKIWVDDKGIINKKNAVWYIYKKSETEEVKFKHDQCLHFLGMTRDGIHGMPIKDYLKTLVENAQSGQTYINEYFKNGLFAKGILTYTSQVSPEDELKLKERFKRMASGVKNSGSILPVPIGFDFKTINSSMVDSQFLELNQLTMQQIAAAFGVKMHQINSLERATHTNIAEQQKEFYVDTLQAILVMYEQELTWKLLTTNEKEKGYHFKFNVDSILRSSPKERAEYLRIMGDAGYITKNEGRAQEDLPRIDDPNADIPILNGNAIPLNLVGQQYVVKGGEQNE